MMPADHIDVEFTEQVAREPDGLISMVRLHAPKFGDLTFWLNRETNDLEELRPYRFGMFRRRR